MQKDEPLIVVDAEGGMGDDTFLAVQDPRGRIWKWFRTTETQPARANDTNPPRVVERETPAMTPEQKLIDLSNRIAAERGISLRDATSEAGNLLKADAKAWHDLIRDDDTVPRIAPSPASQIPPGKAAVGRMVLEKQQHGLSQDAAIEEVFLELTTGRTPGNAVPFALATVRPGETFDLAVSRTAAERGIGLGEAAKLVGAARPDLAAGR
jgi:hypothetical protein